MHEQSKRLIENEQTVCLRILFIRTETSLMFWVRIFLAKLLGQALYFPLPAQRKLLPKKGKLYKQLADLYRFYIIFLLLIYFSFVCIGKYLTHFSDACLNEFSCICVVTSDSNWWICRKSISVFVSNVGKHTCNNKFKWKCRAWERTLSPIYDYWTDKSINSCWGLGKYFSIIIEIHAVNGLFQSKFS